MSEKLPQYVGLCPVHHEEFWFPVDAGEGHVRLTCPAHRCERDLVVYRRLRAARSGHLPTVFLVRLAVLALAFGLYLVLQSDGFSQVAAAFAVLIGVVLVATRRR